MLALAALGMTPPLKAAIANALRMGAQAVSGMGLHSAQERILVLPQMRVYALQLGVYDSGERAQSEMNRLMALGVPCIIWQREQMRIICSAASQRDVLDMSAVKERDSCVIEELLPQVSVRISADSSEIDDAQALMLTPDSLFARLERAAPEALEAIVQETLEAAKAAEAAHPENALYTELAQSLAAWCGVTQSVMDSHSPQAALTFAQATICTLCRELRMMLTT